MKLQITAPEWVMIALAAAGIVAVLVTAPAVQTFLSGAFTRETLGQRLQRECASLLSVTGQPRPLSLPATVSRDHDEVTAEMEQRRKAGLNPFEVIYDRPTTNAEQAAFEAAMVRYEDALMSCIRERGKAVR